MTSVSDLMQNHRSIRRFTQEPITETQLTTIIEAAKSASASSFLQCCSIIRITDMSIRTQAMALAKNQAYIQNAAEFLIFCADFNRHKTLMPDAKLGYTEQLLVASIDAAMMGQNALLAAESMELGGVFIGAIRNHPKEITALLKLPQNVFPLFGLCLGHPAQNPECKPRLPNSILLHENEYQPLDMATIDRYDAKVRTYYQQRSDNQKSQCWSDVIKAKLVLEAKPYMFKALQNQGFLQK